MSHRVILHNPSVHQFSDHSPTPPSTLISNLSRTCTSFQRLRERPGDDLVRVSSSVLGIFIESKRLRASFFAAAWGCYVG